MTHVQLSQKVAQEETGVVSRFFGTCGPSAVHGSLVRPLGTSSLPSSGKSPVGVQWSLQGGDAGLQKGLALQ